MSYICSLEKRTRPPHPLIKKILEEENWISSKIIPDPITICLSAMLTIGVGFFAYRYYKNSSSTLDTNNFMSKFLRPD